MVQSGSRNRTFVYDSLSRLTSATNPETGPITYHYDNSGTLTSKADGRGITITYTPDALHRITTKTYSNGDPTVHYCYDNQQTACGTASVSNGIGRRTGMSDASGHTDWSYDVMGRVVLDAKTISGTSGSMYYYYNLDGSLSSVDYPDYGGEYYTYSAAGRVTAASWLGVLEGGPLATGITYTAAGAISGYVNGAGVTVANTYNNRLQPSNMKATLSADIFNLTYNFVDPITGHDNGNVYGITNNLPNDSGRSETFTYDSLNRLSTAGTATTWGDQYGYDAWGNLLSKTVLRGTAESILLVVNGNNQFPGWGYDGAGNLVGSPQSNFFNAENQWTSQNTFHVSYLYDGDGERVQASGGASGTRVYWKDESGRVLYEGGTNNTDYFYLGGQLIARTSYGPLTYYYQDELGTTRIQTTSTGSVCYDADYFPWGDEQHVYTNTCAQNYKFNGKERDPDMGVYDFSARFYQDAMARFFQPDWSATVEPVPYAKLDNPQSLNLYAYVANNPTTFRDPDGHDPEGAGGAPQITSGTPAGNPATDAQKQQAQNQSETQSATSQGLKGTGKIVLGIGLVATAAVGDAPGGVVGALILTSAVLGGTTTTVSGVTDVLGAATHTDVSKAQEALDATGNLPGLAVSAAGGNLKAGQTVAAISDTAQLAVSPREAVKNPATTADAVRTLMGAKDLASSVWNSVKSYLVNPGPPTTPTPGPPQ